MRTLVTTITISLLASSLASQAATYTLFGAGCNGSPTATCIAQNDVNPTFRLASLPNEYAYPVVNATGAPIQVVGFEVFTQSNTGAVETANAGVYLDNSGPGATTHTLPAFTAAAIGSITADGAPAWRHVTVVPPVVIPAGGAFYLGVDAFSRIAPPQHTSPATPSPASIYWRRPNNAANAWAVSGSVSLPILRVHCADAAVPVPSLVNTGTPQLGASMALTVGGGLAFTPGFVVFALDDTNWLGLPTPVDLAPFGAPGCSNYTSTDVMFLVLLDAAGQGAMNTGIPSDPGLMGVRFFNQSVVLSTVNPLGLLVGNAGAAVVGT